MPECSICNASYTGHGHNAWPVSNGRCCDICNDMAVLPVRRARSDMARERLEALREAVKSIRKPEADQADK
jgi:hypothetical protein